MLEAQGGIVADRNKPEKGGACRCWASPGYGKGWSYIKKVNKVSVTVEDNFGNGGRNFTRTIPFDKLSAIMSAADVETARKEGRLAETAFGDGFFVADRAETPKESAERVHVEATASKQEETTFDAMKETLKAGIKTVSAPQLFPTPAAIAEQVVILAEIFSNPIDIRRNDRVLEPSAGTGALLSVLNPAGHGTTQAVEINPTLANELHRKFPLIGVVCADFLSCGSELGTFDRVIMNPPFANGQDIHHIEHALTFLKDGGKLVAVCANGPRQREKLMPLADQWIDLPAGSFEEQGTSVNAAIVVISK
jgi:protein-L-isoaspartate O-methyltransferase